MQVAGVMALMAVAHRELDAEIHPQADEQGNEGDGDDVEDPHREQAQREMQSDGLPAEIAQHASHRRFGNDVQLKEKSHEVVGFRIEITRLEGKWKLSQNHPEERRRRVIRALSVQSDEDSQAVAALMAELTTTNPEGDRGEPGTDRRASAH